MLFARINLAVLAGRSFGYIFCFWFALVGFAPELPAAGVTLITHGNSGNTDGWVTGMANALAQRLGGNVPVYRIDVTNGPGGYGALLHSSTGGSPLAHPTGEIIVKLDWRTLANTSHSTFSVADAVAPALAQSNLIAALGGHALAEFPLHLIGHSRGGSLVCELSRRLGELGVWVDQVTTLDAYPLGNDAPVAAYDNVLFAESYYQTDYLLFDGVIIPNSHWRRQTSASGGYGDLFSNWHSDVHLWYHGTIDLGATASDSEAAFTSTTRDAWYATVEQKGTNAGFIYSRLGGGSRLSLLLPNGANSSTIRAGVNQKWDFGAGATNNRAPLTANTGQWPNAIQFSALTTNPVAHGASAEFHLDFQWAVSGSQTQAVAVFLDADRNPLNGNERLVRAGTASGTTGSQVGTGVIAVPLDVTNAPVGNYAVFVKLSGGGRSRLMYAPAELSVVPGTAAPWLDIRTDGDGTVVLGVNGTAGQTVVVQQSPDWNAWQPLATNTLASARWELSRPAAGTNSFYRAVLQP